MSTSQADPKTPAVASEEFQEVLDDLASGVRRPEQMRAACERMDRLREENRELLGEVKAAVELIRETRGEA